MVIGIGFVSICWDHFKPEDYLLKMDPKYVFENGMGSLKQSAVPSQNLPPENLNSVSVLAASLLTQERVTISLSKNRSIQLIFIVCK